MGPWDKSFVGCGNLEIVNGFQPKPSFAHPGRPKKTLVSPIHRRNPKMAIFWKEPPSPNHHVLVSMFVFGGCRWGQNSRHPFETTKNRGLCPKIGCKKKHTYKVIVFDVFFWCLKEWKETIFQVVKDGAESHGIESVKNHQLNKHKLEVNQPPMKEMVKLLYDDDDDDDDEPLLEQWWKQGETVGFSFRLSGSKPPCFWMGKNPRCDWKIMDHCPQCSGWTFNNFWKQKWRFVTIVSKLV